MTKTMSEVLLDKWTWIILFSIISIIVVPLVVVFLILQLPPIWAFVATIIIILLWGVASGYKDYVISKRNEKEKSKGQESS